MNLRAFLYKFNRLAKLHIVFFLVFNDLSTLGQAPKMGGVKAPFEIKFADVTFQLNDVSRFLMAQEIASLMKNTELKKEYLKKLSLILPLVDPLIAKAKVPSDFKFLSIYNKYQKTTVISSFLEPGVFWCMDMSKALDVDLRVNYEVDERKHLILSTKGALVCLKRNQVLYENWGTTLFAHLASREVLNILELNKKWSGRYIVLDSPAYSSLIQFLAFKWVLEAEFSNFKNENPNILYEYTNGKGKTLNLIAADLKVEPKELVENNTWLKSNRVPDSEANVLIVVPAARYHNIRILSEMSKNSNVSKFDLGFPVVKDNADLGFGKGGSFYTINDLNGIKADFCDGIVTLAYESKLSIANFLECNDMTEKDLVEVGQIYYIVSKKEKASIPHHIVKEEETLWEISQQYGIKLSSLLKYNRMETVARLQRGRVVWMQEKRPKNKPIEYIDFPSDEETVKPENIRFDDEIIAEIETNSNFGTKIEEPKEMIIETPPLLQKQEERKESLVEKAEKKIDEVSDLENVIAIKKTDTSKTKEKNNIVDSKPIIKREVSTKVIEVLPKNKEDYKDNLDFKKTNNKEYIVHEVKKGETLYRISVNYNVSVAQLYRLNNLNNNIIEIGDKIIVKRY